MSEFVTMSKDGVSIDVHPDAVDNHQKIGWSVATEGQARVAAALSSLPEVKAVLAQMQDRIQELETLASDRHAKIQELEADVELASNDEAPGDADLIALKAKVTALEQKKADGTATQADKMLLGRLSKKIPV